MATMVLYFLLFTINFGRNLAESNDPVINDVYITESTSSFYDIPKNCSLINNKMPLNIPYNGAFWVSAKIELKKSVNPVGVVLNCESINERRKTLDECIKQCESKPYFKHGPESCMCTDENKTIEGVSSTQPCENADMGMCSTVSKGCVLYKHVKKQDLFCYFTYYNNENGLLVFQTEKCTEKKNFGYICSKGKMSSPGRNISWYDAFQLCKDIGDELMQETVTTNDELKDGSMFWIAYFRRTDITWGKENNSALCVAAYGNLSWTSKFCTEKLPSLCIEKNNRGKNSSSHLDCCCLASVIILVVAIIKRT